MVSSDTNAVLPPGAALTLQHPSGSSVVLVGVAHVSAKAAKDAEDCIMAVQPAIVVIELDQMRYKKLLENADRDDPFGLRHAAAGSSVLEAPAKWHPVVMAAVQPLRIIFGGHLVEFGLCVAYAVSGALLGVPPGDEFRAAVQAAERVGAEIVLADRDQDVTMRRLSRAALLAQQPPTLPAALPGDAGVHGAPERASLHARRVQGAGSQPHVPPDEVLGRIADRWKGMLQGAGCKHPDAVLKAFQRIMVSGSRKDGKVAPDDVAVVRSCGQRVVETYRAKAMQEGDEALTLFEVEAMREMGQSTGLLGMESAVHEVLVRERDKVLGRRLWEAGEKAAGLPVVGIVGAGHVQGIAKHWEWAGTPEAAREVRELETAPANPNTTGSLITATIVGGGFAYLAYRRPRVAALAGAVTTFAVAPYLAAMVYTVNRWSSLLENVLHAGQQVPLGEAASGESWGDSPQDVFE